MRHNYVWSVAGDPETIVIAAAASPRQSHDKRQAESFIYRRTATSSWSQVRHGLPDPAGRRTAVLATHGGQPGVFFAIWENDLFGSTDGGATWSSLDTLWPNGFQVGEPRAFAIGPP